METNNELLESSQNLVDALNHFWHAEALHGLDKRIIPATPNEWKRKMAAKRKIKDARIDLVIARQFVMNTIEKCKL